MATKPPLLPENQARHKSRQDKIDIVLDRVVVAVGDEQAKGSLAGCREEAQEAMPVARLVLEKERRVTATPAKGLETMRGAKNMI